MKKYLEYINESFITEALVPGEVESMGKIVTGGKEYFKKREKYLDKIEDIIKDAIKDGIPKHDIKKHIKKLL